MKKILTGFMLLISAAVCFAQQANFSGAGATNQNAVMSLPTSCDTYATCLDLGAKERAAGVDSVLFHYSSGRKDIRYNLFDNLSIKFSSNVCPPIVDVYKKVNNINYMMDVFKRDSKGECISYFANITGDGKNRDAIIGQLEIKFCNDDVLFESCDNGLVYSKINNFITTSTTKSDNSDLNFKPDNQSISNPSMSGQIIQPGDVNIGQGYPVNPGAKRQ